MRCAHTRCISVIAPRCYRAPLINYEPQSRAFIDLISGGLALSLPAYSLMRKVRDSGTERAGNRPGARAHTAIELLPTFERFGTLQSRHSPKSRYSCDYNQRFLSWFNLRILF